MTLTEVLSILAPIVGGGLGVRAVSSYYVYRRNKPKTAAEAQKIDAEIVVTFADGWRTYAEKMEAQAAKLGARLDANEREIDDLKEAMRNQDEKNRQTLREKNEQIYDLQSKNRKLELRVNDLEIELSRYRSAEIAKLTEVKDPDHGL